MPKFKDKKFITDIGKIYIDDPILTLQSMYAESGEEHLGFRAEKVIEEIESLASSVDIAAEIAYFMVWFMDIGLAVDESLYEPMLNEHEYEKYNYDKIPGFEKKNKYFMHGRIAQLMAKNMYMVVDNNILKALAYHETLLPNVEHSNEEKILFLADKLVPKFENSSHVDVVKNGLKESFNSAIRNYLDWYINNASTLGLQVHPYMPQVLSYYRDFTKSLD